MFLSLREGIVGNEGGDAEDGEQGDGCQADVEVSPSCEVQDEVGGRACTERAEGTDGEEDACCEREVMVGEAEFEGFQPCHEACRDADADEQASEEEGIERFCFGEEEGSECCDADEHDLDGFGSVAIEQDTERQLAQAEREEVGGGEIADGEAI